MIDAEAHSSVERETVETMRESDVYSGVVGDILLYPNNCVILNDEGIKL